VEGGSTFILFPEGTRARDGKLGTFKPGIGMMVAGSDVPVVPCALEGCFEAMPPDAQVPRPKRITVRIGQPRQFREIPNTRDGWKEIASTLQADVAALQKKPE
jgi:1-acyl-sn-glycerol-3-phosphate acyltransferase